MKNFIYGIPPSTGAGHGRCCSGHSFSIYSLQRFPCMQNFSEKMRTLLDDQHHWLLHPHFGHINASHFYLYDIHNGANYRKFHPAIFLFVLRFWTMKPLFPIFSNSRILLLLLPRNIGIVWQRSPGLSGGGRPSWSSSPPSLSFSAWSNRDRRYFQVYVLHRRGEGPWTRKKRRKLRTESTSWDCGLTQKRSARSPVTTHTSDWQAQDHTNPVWFGTLKKCILDSFSASAFGPSVCFFPCFSQR